MTSVMIVSDPFYVKSERPNQKTVRDWDLRREGGEFVKVEGDLKLHRCGGQALLCQVCIAMWRVQISNNQASSHDNNTRKVHGKSFLCLVDMNLVLTWLYPAVAMVCLIWRSAAARSNSGLHHWNCTG